MDRTVVITGGSSGIGKATAELFAEHGWKVFEWSRSGQSTEKVTHVSCDVTDPEQTKAAVQQVLKQTDHIDVFISNAVRWSSLHLKMHIGRWRLISSVH